MCDEGHRESHPHLTRLGPEVLSAEEVAHIYAMRWGIELLLKSPKSSYALEGLRTKKATSVEALIWSALLTLLVSRRLRAMIRARAVPQWRPRYTQLRRAIEFRDAGEAVLGYLPAHLDLGPLGHGGQYKINFVFVKKGPDLKIKRHRF